MRRLSIKAISLLLTALLLFSAFGGVLSVFAEAEVTEDVYGTSANGFSTNGGAVYNIAATNGPQNLDFSEGFKYFTSKSDKNGYASDMLVLDTETDGTVYLRTVKASDVTEGDDGNSNYTLETWKGIESAPFTLDEAYNGKQIYIILKYKRTQAAVDAGKNGDLSVRLFYTVTSEDGEGNTKVSRLNAEYSGFGGTKHIAADEYNTVCYAAVTSDSTTQTNNPVTVDSSEKYTVNIQDTSIPKLDDVEGFKDSEYTHLQSLILAVKNDDGSYTDISNGNKIYGDGTPFGGTEADGIKRIYMDDSFEGIVSKDEVYMNTKVYAPAVGFQNADFSNGFKYWTLRRALRDNTELVAISQEASVENGILTFADSTDTYPGISSSLFTLPGITAGDKLVATVEARNGAVSYIALKEWGIDANGKSAIKGSAKTDNPSGTSNTSWGTASTPVLTVKTESPIFSVTLQRNQSSAMQIKGFHIYKVTDNGDYIDVASGYDAETATAVNANGGSAENGLLDLSGNVASSVSYANPYDSLKNGDFSEGFKYWSVKSDHAGYASSGAEITEEGALVTSNHYDGLVSSTVVIPECLNGKCIGVRYAYKGKTQGQSEFRIYKNASIALRAYPNGERTDALAFKDDNTAANNVTVATGDKITLEMQGGAAGGQFLYEYVELVYFDLGAKVAYSWDGTKEYSWDGTTYGYAAPAGGTEENGIYADNSSEGIAWTAKNTYVLPEFRNGDFSEGFRYWTLKRSDAAINDRYLSQQAAVDKTTGIVTFKDVKRDNGSTDPLYAGMRSQGFTVDSSKLKATDVLYAALDFRATPESGGNIHVGLYAYDKTGNTLLGNGGANYGVQKSNKSTEEWMTAYSAGITTDGEDVVFFMYMQRYFNEGGTQIKNYRLLRSDRGGLENAPKVNLDGTLDTSAGQLYGDANNDGAVDLIDLVRMKKYASDSTSNAIFLAAVDMDNDDAINASDLAAVVKAIIDPAYVLTKADTSAS